jgi:signal transduction histidine kinase
LKLYKQTNDALLQQTKELQSARKELETANTELHQINKTKDKFFSIIAHDLKSPFNSMLGISNLLNKNYNQLENTERKEYIEIIDVNIQNTYKLLENLLVWSNSQRGSIKFNPEEENLYLLSKEIINLMQLAAESKSIKLINEIPQELFIYADKYMLSTIIRNLLSNAVKFTNRNGKVIIKAKKDNFGTIEISVIDNGVGISGETQSQIFDVSQTKSTNGTANEVGSGLGLFLCKDFVEKHGGTISVESKVDEGSKFIFSIPPKENK